MKIKQTTLLKIEDLIKRYPALAICRNDLINAVEIICESFYAGNKLITCGNGGSAADAQHIVGELMKGFLLPRKIKDYDKDFQDKLKKIYPEDAEYFEKYLQGALPAVSLVGETALMTAFTNDNCADLIFAQQVYGIGKAGDVLLAITTSGNSVNILHAVKTANLKNIKTIVLTGRSGGKVKSLADISICAPADTAYTIQEFHLPVYHMLCIALENEFFN